MTSVQPTPYYGPQWMAGIQHMPRNEDKQAVEDAARQICTYNAQDAGCDMSTFIFEELQPSTINGVVLENEDTPFRSSEWRAFHWKAQLPQGADTP